MQASFAVFVNMHVSLGCHFGTYVQHLICYHSGAQATSDDYVVALLSGSLKCSMASVVSDLSNSHHRVMQQVQTGLLASIKFWSVYTVTWCIKMYLIATREYTKLRYASCLGSLHMMHMLCDNASQSLRHPAQFGKCTYLCLACKRNTLCFLGVGGMSQMYILPS